MAGCAVDDDCVGVADAPRCDVEAAICVGCIANAQCPAGREICDAESQSCRGCTSDDDCSSGVCVEAVGTCAPGTAILYVAPRGKDAGECTRESPCLTLRYALGQRSRTRNVIRLLGGVVAVGTNQVEIGLSSPPLVIDGNNTTLLSDGPLMLTLYADLVLEGVVVVAAATTAPQSIKVRSGGLLRLANASVDRGAVDVESGGKLQVSDVEVRNSTWRCAIGGDLAITRTRFAQSVLWTSACDLALTSSTMGPGFGSLSPSGGLLRIENNIFLETRDDETVRLGLRAQPGSVFRFNTVVNSSATRTAAGVFCYDTSVTISNNIFSSNSAKPVGTLCGPVNNSLFDTSAAAFAANGVSNVVGDSATFFKNRSANDFRLVATSPARGMGEPGLVDRDFAGNPRPSPRGTLPDVGAFEYPE